MSESESAIDGRIPPTQTSWMGQAALTGGCAVLSAATKDAIFYSIDSYKVMKQAGQRINVSNLYRGTIPIAIFGSGFSFGAFFICYNPIRNALTKVVGTENEGIAVLIASSLSAIPSSIVGVPADVLKKQLVLGNKFASPSSIPASTLHQLSRNIWRNHGIRGFFLGWKVNVVRDVPYASLKMSLYEGLARLYISIFYQSNTPSSETGKKTVDKLHGTEAAAMGFSSGVLAAFITCPIDCVNTRIKNGEFAHIGMIDTYRQIVVQDGVRALFRGVAPRCAILGMGSTVFWYIQATLLKSLS